MGKQINYYLEYNGFLKIAEAALQRGCEILKVVDGKVVRSNDISAITPDCFNYYFHYPLAGEVKINVYESGKEYVDGGYNPSGNTVIEAGFSRISDKDKKIGRARLFTVSGYYEDNGEWVPRPDNMTKLYCALERVAKKVALRTEWEIEYVKPNGGVVMRKYIDYISPFCAHLLENGYSRGAI